MSSEKEMKEIYDEHSAIKHSFSHEYNERSPVLKESCWSKVPKRYIVAIMAFLGFCNTYALRTNLSVAIVAMVNNHTVIKNGTIIKEDGFNWDTKLQGLVLGSFFYGYIITQIPGGWLAAHFGGKYLFGGGIFCTAVLTLFTSLCANSSVYLLVALRIMEGLCEGVTYPSIHAIWSRWAPPLEKTKLATISFSGSYVGTVISMLLSGVLAEKLGWQSIFYVFGVLGIIWFIAWCYIIKEKPSEHTTISNRELEYIQCSIGYTDEQTKVTFPPWSRILTSLPVWAIILAHFSENWGFYTLLTGLPTFLSDVLHYKLPETGFLAAVPYFVMAIMVQVAGQLADYLRQQGHLTTTQVRKLFNCSAFVCQAIFMIITAYTMSTGAAVACLTLAVGFGGFAWAGFSVNHLDIAPQYASILMGISNCIATIPGIVSPTITGLIVVNKSAAEWQMVFYIAAAVYISGGIFYLLFASGEKQKWADFHLGYSPCAESRSSEDVPYGGED